LRRTAEQALELHRELGNDEGAAIAFLLIAETHLRQFKHDEARARLNDALALAQKIDNRRMIGNIKSASARNFHFEGKTEEARRMYAEALAIARAHGDDRLRKTIVANLAEVEFAKGDAVRALELARESADIMAGNQYVAANNIAAYLLYLGKFEEARSAARNALRLSRDAQLSGHVAISIQNLAFVAAVRGDARLSARLLGHASNTFDQHNFTLEHTEMVINEKLRSLLREKLRDDEIVQLLKEGEGLTEDQAVEEALRI
jgi:tetratricopeptide (TPR) repeat protein